MESMLQSLLKKIFLSSKDKSNFYLEVRVVKSLRNLYVIFLQYITVKIQSITVKICAIINKKITHCCGQNTPINPKINAPSSLHLSVTDKSQGSFEPGTASLRGKALDQRPLWPSTLAREAPELAQQCRCYDGSVDRANAVLQSSQ